ncbi:DUF992 domain-containing protein [Prosthecomicrobium pneumaticum]|uniref:DUF992 domain-containing protein n=1 Tax=Prosthecomicrobium pneumaticum TaxID=81895 RepID=A0A7W9FLE5_9HYPH|nr:DUF992 domain-containing protein [Prosthecomicrobium pneumaticum]MBB5752816.1 hypothetical protein [Prosthecomicrobium pneumaticum]
MTIKTLALAAGTALLAFAAAAPASAQSGVKIGLLECTVDPGLGFVLGSAKGMECTFRPNQGHPEHYAGTITKLGIDVGFTERTLIVWAVIAPHAGLPDGALQGTYGGVSAEATVGGGLGANVLVGGLEDSVSLQPVSVQGQVGLNASLAVSALRLTYQR